MNLIDAEVVEVLGEPVEKFGKWFVPVRVTSYGRESNTEQMCNSKKESDLVDVGFKMQI